MGRQLINGFAHEYTCASKIVEKSPHGYWSNDPVQKRLQANRKKYVPLLTSKEWKKIDDWSKQTALELPEAIGPVEFVEESANGKYVYDVNYRLD